MDERSGNVILTHIRAVFDEIFVAMSVERRIVLLRNFI